MSRAWWPVWLSVLSGCAAEPQRSVEPYLREAPAGSFAAIDSEPRLSGFRDVFTHLDSSDLPERIRAAYAETLWFNDTFHTMQRRDQLEAYFMSMQGKARTTVTLLDVAVNGDHALLRWTMRIEFSLLWKEADVHSTGITHLHWNEEGQIDLHQDYWDGVEGFYAHIPVLGGMLRSVRARLGEVPE